MLLGLNSVVITGTGAGKDNAIYDAIAAQSVAKSNHYFSFQDFASRSGTRPCGAIIVIE